MEYAQTVPLLSRVQADAEAADYIVRTHQRRDGRVAYEVVDKLTGRVKGRSRSFQKIRAYLARLRGTRGA